jgi:fructose-bisphosphate aldolase class I
MYDELQSVAHALLADGKGILAADETPKTLTKRFEALGIASTEDSRRAYREMLFTAPGLEAFIGGVILQNETFRQASSSGKPLVKVLAERGIAPGIKVDAGAKPLAGSPNEMVTEGLDGLRDRLADYREQGARFAKWRAVIKILDDLPSSACIAANAHALARYAALCQEQGLVPIVEPEVLMDGGHSLERSEQVTGRVLGAVFQALSEQHVELEAMLLKPNMVIAGKSHPDQASTEQVASATLRVLRRHAPSAVPGIVFLSGGQDERQATRDLAAICRLPPPKPWTISYSYGRALQDSALKTWGGRDENLEAGREAVLLRARCNSAACVGTYADKMEHARAHHGRHGARAA